MYNFTNNEQFFNVPSEIDEVLLYVWGAGGGGGGYINGGCGGSGGYSSAIINVKDIDKLYIHVGGGGEGNQYNSSVNEGYQYGGIGGKGGGSGGGKSGIYINSIADGNEILISGGGGGAGGTSIAGKFCNGGGGGGLKGNNGSIESILESNSSSKNNMGGGGTQIKGGDGGRGNIIGNDGTRGQGGDAIISIDGGTSQAGGGAGYWGGGSGGTLYGRSVGSGGGGSGYYDKNYTKNAVLIASDTVLYDDVPINPPNSDNQYYIENIGKGGINNGGNGGNGLVILLYKILNLGNSETEYKLPFKDLDIPFSSEINFFTGTLKYENNNWAVTNEYDKRLEIIEKELFVLNLDEIEIINNKTLLNENEISIISNIVVNNNINTCNHITNISNELIGNIIDIIDLDVIVNNIDTSLEIISNKVTVNDALILSIINNVNNSNLHFKDKILNLEIGSNNLIDDIAINSIDILRIENKIDDVESDLLNKIILEKGNLKIDISDSKTELSNILSETIELNKINNSNYCDKLNNNISNYIFNIIRNIII